MSRDVVVNEKNKKYNNLLPALSCNYCYLNWKVVWRLYADLITVFIAFHAAALNLKRTYICFNIPFYNEIKKKFHFVCLNLLLYSYCIIILLSLPSLLSFHFDYSNYMVRTYYLVYYPSPQELRLNTYNPSSSIGLPPRVTIWCFIFLTTVVA